LLKIITILTNLMGGFSAGQSVALPNSRPAGLYRVASDRTFLRDLS